MLQNNQQEHQNSNILSTPKLLENFQQPYINSDNGNEVNYVIDIPEPDTNLDTNNNSDGNSNIILNVDPGVESSPTGSQVGSM